VKVRGSNMKLWLRVAKGNGRKQFVLGFKSDDIGPDKASKQVQMQMLAHYSFVSRLGVYSFFSFDAACASVG
jgi:hypothetical protein